MMSEAAPLMLYMEKADGQEVALQILPTDDFYTFLLKARSLIGYDIDINSITYNQPVALTDNVYQFLLNSDNTLSSELKQPIVPSANTEDLYILDDGTQICASQIHFDNEDPSVDLSSEKIPFVKYSDVPDDVEGEDNITIENVLYNIIDSPVRKHKDVINGLVIPFKLVQNNSYKAANKIAKTNDYESQFTKYLEVRQQVKTYATLNTVTNRNKSPRSLIRDKFIDDSFQKNNDDYTRYTREDILNMFKDSPVTTAPCDNQSNQGFMEKRRHVRKSDPTRVAQKSYYRPMSYDVNGVLIAESRNQNCFICSKFVDNNREKLYLFDNEDQRLHRSSPQRKLATKLKIICEQCLENNFRPCRKSPNQSLSSDEVLVIRNNHQYIFQKTNCLNFNLPKCNEANIAVKETIYNNNVQEFNQADVICNRVVDSNGNVTVADDKLSSSDVEIIENEPECDDLDNLEDADEEVIEFLGKYQRDDTEISELKCRFCAIIFGEVAEVIEHGVVHKHVTDDGDVFPCPLCDYGYANFKWLKGHLNAAHGKTTPTEIKTEIKSEETKLDEDPNTDCKNECSPVASRTRSATKTDSEEQKEVSNKPAEEPTAPESKFEIKTEVKQEVLNSSDDEIWIVQAADDTENNAKLDHSIKNKCSHCSVQFTSVSSLMAHKCRRRGRRKNNSITEPTENNMLKEPRKKKKGPSSDPQIVTCHNCNESFTSKVRLKFHMQFHDNTSMLTPEGYSCPVCKNTKFSTETALFDHVHFQHHKQSRWQCPITGCGKTFYLRATLTKHSRTHTDTRRYICVTCGKRFLDKQTLDEHGVTHLRIKPFQCHICLKQLTRRSRLRMHLRAHEEELCPRLVLVCAMCSRAFRDHLHVQEHMTSSPECIEEFTKQLKEEETVMEQLSPTSGLVRHSVQIVASPKIRSLIHREASGPEARELLSTVPDAALTIIRCVEIEKAFRCEYCEDVFYLESGLNSHRAIHKNVKNPFICHICKVSFATYSRCTTHKTTHGFYKRAPGAKQQNDASKPAGPSSTGVLGYGDFPVVKHFLCEDCGRSYLHWTYLQVHRRMKHATDNFSYKCAQCGLTFVNSWSLTYHKKKHCKGDQHGSNPSKTKEREDYRIPCRDCDQVLPNKTALYKHRKKEHSDLSLHMDDEADSPSGTTCVCGRGFPCVSRDAHARHCCVTHSETSCYDEATHTCGECGHAFRTPSVLAEHSRVHSGERPYPCDICGVAFRRSTAMRNHRLIHTGERAWACSRCPKRFRIRSDLRTHLRLKHPAKLYVIEVRGLNPSPEEVMERLSVNKIPYDKVIEITKMSFTRNTCSVIPSCSKALDMLSHWPRTQIACSRTRPDKPFELYQPMMARRGRGISKSLRKPKILQRGNSNLAYTITAATEGAPDYNRIQPQPNHAPTASVPQDSHTRDMDTVTADMTRFMQ